MAAPKTVLCIMDLAAVGRSSLAVVLPALAACGVQGCPLPASLFSSHTGGFADVALLDTAAFAEAALARYQSEGLSFDAVYIGYLRGPGQLAAARRALEAFPAAFKVVDPALGDAGKAYRGIDADTIRGMAALCRMADLITPNFTECALLAGDDPGVILSRDEFRRQAESLLRPGASLLVTSVPAPSTRVGPASLGEEDGEAPTAIAGREGEDEFTFVTHRVPQDYPGTGDLFTASVLGLLLRGHPLRAAAQQAAAFVGAAVRATFEGSGEARRGLWFEPLLPHLTAAANQSPSEEA